MRFIGYAGERCRTISGGLGGRAAVLALCCAAMAGRLSAAPHPRLLMTPDDLPRLRHVCGVGEPMAPSAGLSPFGCHRSDFQAVRAWIDHRVAGEALPGELLAAAFLHLVDPHSSADAKRLALIGSALERPDSLLTDVLELIIALDWCWADLPPATRRAFLLAVRERVGALTAADSPLDPHRFRMKLAGLALALAIDEQDDPAPSWAVLRSAILDAARKYFTTTFPTFVTWRGLSPTGPAVAAREESDSVLAVELAAVLLGGEVWTEYRASVGRWMEHYVLVAVDHPELQHQFLRDDGNHAPLTPAPHGRNLLPLTAALLAARTGDPAAAHVADRVAESLRAATDDPLQAWRWVPIVFDLRDAPRCDLHRLPVGRHLGGAVILRGGHGPDATLVWIDAAQPFLRRRQHFDAGHFLIRRGGHLVVDAADDISFEAIPGKGGSQRLGTRTQPFDFEQFSAATIAHNCVLFWDQVAAARWYGVPCVPVGGQRWIEETCTDFATALAAQRRQTGRTVAWGQHCFGSPATQARAIPTGVGLPEKRDADESKHAAAYLALDLTPAYEERVVRSYTREFVFLLDRVLVVIDRIGLAPGLAVPTWIVNVPSRPLVDGKPLPDDVRVAGRSSEAGVWRCDGAEWLRWVDGDGALWFAALLPDPRVLRVVGGPARTQTIRDGPWAGRTYMGGDEDGFERLVLPAERPGALNAWYRLGTPEVLGPHFGLLRHWGRIEIEPPRRANECVFVTVLVADRADAGSVPRANLVQSPATFSVTVELPSERAELTLPAGLETGGALTLCEPAAGTWRFPAEVVPDGSLPTLMASPAD